MCVCVLCGVREAYCHQIYQINQRPSPWWLITAVTISLPSPSAAVVRLDCVKYVEPGPFLPMSSCFTTYSQNSGMAETISTVTQQPRSSVTFRFFGIEFILFQMENFCSQINVLIKYFSARQSTCRAAFIMSERSESSYRLGKCDEWGLKAYGAVKQYHIMVKTYVMTAKPPTATCVFDVDPQISTSHKDRVQTKPPCQYFRPKRLKPCSCGSVIYNWTQQNSFFRGWARRCSLRGALKAAPDQMSRRMGGLAPAWPLNAPV